jgi:hypothetical protein
MAAQPNFANMHKALLGLTHEVGLLPNLPGLNPPAPQAPNIQDIIQEIADLRAETQQNFNNL